jgi:hypothetical protein
MAASQGFDYGGLSPAHQERLRQLASRIHSIGCQQTHAGVEIGKMLIEAKTDFSMAGSANGATVKPATARGQLSF